MASDAPAAAAAPAMTPDLRQAILSQIADQVKQLLMQAKQDSESKVKVELRVISDAMTEMDSKLSALDKQLSTMQPDSNVAGPDSVEQNAVAQALAKVEQHWGKELGKLKQELHQTIFAHNHNADLMRHQKEAIDQIRNELNALKTPQAQKATKQHIQKVEALIKSQQKAQRLEPFFERLQGIEAKLQAHLRWQMSANLQATAALNQRNLQAAAAQAAAAQRKPQGGGQRR